MRLKPTIPGMRRNSRQRGFNLVEVLIAMALLGTVLVAVMTLFYLGRRNVYSGKQMTKAIAVGQRVMEDLAPLDQQQVYNGLFAINDTDAGYSATVDGVPYTNCRIRSTDPNLIASPPTDIQTEKTGGPGFLTTWKNQIGTDLLNGSVTVIMQPKNDPGNAAPNETFGGALIVRIRVLVKWSETNRPRSIIIDSAKPY